MYLRNALLFHSITFLAQPTYLMIRWLFNDHYFSQASPIWLTLVFLSWTFIVSQLTIPFLACPFLRLPSPPGDTIPLGHAWSMGDRQPPTQIDEASKTINDGIVAVWMPLYTTARLILTTPEAAMEVLNTRSYDWKKPRLARKVLKPLLGSGLINVEGSAHKAMRKIVTPPFSGRHIREMVPIFWSKGLDFVQAVSRELKQSINGEIEVTNHISRVTLDIIGATGLGVDFNTVNSQENKLAGLYRTITGPDRGPVLLFFAINMLLPPWLIRRLHGTVYARVANAVRELRVQIRHLLAEKKQTLHQNDNDHTDIIATIMRSADFTDDYLCDQILTFFAAGHDTISSALTWTSWLLALHPEVQSRLHKECHKRLFGLSTDEMSADVIDDIPYLTAVCNESLRLYPPISVTARTAAVNTIIGNQKIPRGTHLVIAPWTINRDPKLWGKDAYEFNPNRWLEGSSPGLGGAKTPYAFQTFLYGPRSCIGQSFAKLELKCLLAVFIMNFHLAPSAGGKEVKAGGIITMKPKDGLRLRLRELKPRARNEVPNTGCSVKVQASSLS